MTLQECLGGEQIADWQKLSRSLRTYSEVPEFAVMDGSYQRMGGDKGVELLVEVFYAAMDVLPEAAEIRAMHPDDLALSKAKLSTFLCGWLGGPRRYAEVFGKSIAIPHVHRPFPIGPEQAEAWLLCMREALAVVLYDDADFAHYLNEAFRVPASRIVAVQQA